MQSYSYFSLFWFTNEEDEGPAYTCYSVLKPKPSAGLSTLATMCTPSWQIIKFWPVVYKINRLHPVSLQNPNKVFLQRWKSWRISMFCYCLHVTAQEAPPPFQKPGSSPWMHSWRHPYPYKSLGRQGMTLNCPWVVPLCRCQHVALMTAESKEWKSDIAPYNPLTLSCLHRGKTQPARKPVQWVAVVIPTSCEKHPGRPGPRAVCIGGLQDRGGSAAEPFWCTRSTQVDFRQKGWNKAWETSYPPSKPLQERRKHLQPLSWKTPPFQPSCYYPWAGYQHFQAPLAWKQERLWTTGLGGHHSLPTGKACTPARLTPQTNNNPFP